MAMRWHDLLFAHWPIEPSVLRNIIPACMELDTFDGQGWIGIVPFRMTGVRHRYLPSPPWVSAFAELNVRTYVEVGGLPGVWFFSLDAANPVAVLVARRAFHLPYFDADMSVTVSGDEIVYQSTRTHRDAPAAELSIRYRPIGDVLRSEPGSLEEFLTERYRLFACDGAGVPRCGDILHEPWPLQPAEAEIEHNSMTEQVGITLPDARPVLHYAKRLNVVAWRLKSTSPADGV